MSHHNTIASHLGENDILQAVIDVADLPRGQRQHLDECAHCRLQRERLEQELAAKAEPSARQHVADNLILEQLAMEWKTPVPEAEVDAYIAADAQQHGVPPAEHKATLAAEEKLDAIRHAARLTSVVDEMIRRAGGGVD